MELKTHFNQVLTSGVHMALATSALDQPNVRIVNYAYDGNREGLLFFSTFRGNRKIAEFSQNPLVACTPLPFDPQVQAQVRIFGTVQESALSLEELIRLVGAKAPEDAATLREGGDLLVIYEIHFSEAWVTVGMSEAKRYSISS